MLNVFGPSDVKNFEKKMTSIESNEPVSDDRCAAALNFNDQGLRKYLQVDFDDAIADYSKAIELNPKLAAAYFNRGTVHYRLGDFELAVKDLSKSVELDPTNCEFLEGLQECRRMIEVTKNKR